MPPSYNWLITTPIPVAKDSEFLRIDMLIGGDPSAIHLAKWPAAALTTGFDINILGLSASARCGRRNTGNVNFISQN